MINKNKNWYLDVERRPEPGHNYLFKSKLATSLVVF